MPKKPVAGTPRTVIIRFRVTEEEEAELDRRRAGQDRSAWLRDRIFGGR